MVFIFDNRNPLTKIIAVCFCAVFLVTCSKSSSNPEIAPEPEVRIIYPKNNAQVTDTTSISVEASDDKGVVKVEMYINNATSWDRTFYVEPYRYLWTTPQTQDSTKYRIYAKAYDGDGNVTSSNVVDVVVYRFGAPSNLSVIPINDGMLQLNWVDNSVHETGFIIEKAASDGIYLPLNTVMPNQTTYFDSSVDTSQAYSYRIKAVFDQHVSAWSPTAKINFVKSLYFNKLMKIVSSAAPGYPLPFVREQNRVTWCINRNWDGKFIKTNSFQNNYELLSTYGRYSALKWNPESNVYALGTTSGKMHIYDYELIGLVGYYSYQFPNAIVDISFSNDMELLAMDNANNIYLLDITNETVTKTFTMNQDSSIAFSFDKNSGFIASAGMDSSINVWHISDEETLQSFRIHDFKFIQILFSRNGNFIYGINGADPNIYVINSRTGGLETTLYGNSDAISFIAMESTGNHLFSGDNAGKFTVWSLKDHSEVYSNIDLLNQKIIAISSYNYSADKIGVSTVSQDGNIRDWLIEKRWLSL